MGGYGSGASKKRKTLPRRFRPGALDKADQRAREIRYAQGEKARIESDMGGAENMSAVQRHDLDRYLHALAQLVRLEAASWNGEPFDRAEYAHWENVRARLAPQFRQRIARRANLADVLAEYATSPVHVAAPVETAEVLAA